MNFNNRYKTFNLLIFILFELIVILLFITVNNEFIKIASGPRVLTGFMFLLVISFGLVMFILVDKKQIIPVEGTGKILESSIPESKDTDIKDIKETEGRLEEKEIDLSRILPQDAVTIEKYAEKLLINMADEFNIVQALFYYRKEGTDIFKCRAQYAYYSDTKPSDFKMGETLNGQAIKNRKTVSLAKIPDNYFTIVSGLGKGIPREIVFLPVIFEDNVIGLIEYATFSTFDFKTERDLNLIAAKAAGALVQLNKK